MNLIRDFFLLAFVFMVGYAFGSTPKWRFIAGYCGGALIAVISILLQ